MYSTIGEKATEIPITRNPIYTFRGSCDPTHAHLLQSATVGAVLKVQKTSQNGLDSSGMACSH